MHFLHKYLFISNKHISVQFGTIETQIEILNKPLAVVPISGGGPYVFVSLRKISI